MDVGGSQVRHGEEPEETCWPMAGEMDKPNMINAEDGEINTQ